MDVRIVTSLKEIPAEAWRRLTEGSSFPFHDYEYLRALEDSGAVGPDKGWQPLYLTAWDQNLLKAALILYARTDSYGEYIFDWGWAEAAHRAQIQYYPKLTSAIPFTPATGPKLIGDASEFAGLLQFQRELEVKFAASSSHHLFITQAETELFKTEGFAIRHTFQYHWRNNGYSDFDSFLERLKRKRRKDIRSERNSLKDSGLRIERITGEQLTPVIAEQMYAFYLSTIEKMGAISYLNKNFFKQIFSTMQDRLVVFFAYAPDSDQPLAGTVNFFKGQTLFGRYWGAFDEIRNLHFELCYYQTIEFAIERGFELFEAGAQGEHKFNRGFLPSLTYSAHHIADARLAGGIKTFIENEKLKVSYLFQDYQAHTPFNEKAPE